jgi:hypothetical protein
MKNIPNEKLTDNFWLYEFIEALPPKGTEMNWKHIDEFSLSRCRMVAKQLQRRRNLINQVFKERNDGLEIGLKITSGFRCKAWEKYRKRDGNSQHTMSWAADVQPVNCSDELAVEIMQWLYKIDNPRNSDGHQGGFAIKLPTREKGNITSIGFLHYDCRTGMARWNY